MNGGLAGWLASWLTGWLAGLLVLGIFYTWLTTGVPCIPLVAENYVLV